VSKLKGIEIGDELAIEILAQLVEGKRTVAEIVERTYGLNVNDEGFHSSYSKVRRVVRRLESKGLISRKLLGRDKPYRLTQHAVANLARIGGEEQQLSLFPRFDIAVYLLTTVAAIPVASHSLGWVELGETITIGLLPTFCFLLGISFYGAVRMMRKVL
jgi:DNA-binding transcriptional ArsR family regulator